MRHILIALFLLLSLATGAENTSPVTYAVTGSAKKALLTYRNASGGTEQVLAILPWRLNFTAKTGALLYLSAQSKNRDSLIQVAISSNGTEIQGARSSGDYVIASAKGRVP